MKKTILIIEDDADIAESIRYNLEREPGVEAAVAATGEQGLELIAASEPSLIILDVNLPRMSGFELCRRLRRDPATARLPILILTARSGESDKVLGLELGADDYVTKPFSMRELTARVHALLRRAEGAPLRRLVCDGGRVEIELDNQMLRVGGQPVRLTRKEFALLSLLVQSKGRLLARDYLLNQVWGELQYGDTRTLDVHIRRLRQKLGNEALIETVIGIGYRFAGDE